MLPGVLPPVLETSVKFCSNWYRSVPVSVWLNTAPVTSPASCAV